MFYLLQALLPTCELFSQKGSTAEDAKLDKTLMADLSRQARQPMIVTSADATYCYDRVNHIIMSLLWLVLTNGNIPAIVAALICLQTTIFLQQTGFGKSKTFFGGTFYFPYMMGLGQGNRAVPPSWIQLSTVLVNVFKQLNLGALIQDPITAEVIHSMGNWAVAARKKYPNQRIMAKKDDFKVAYCHLHLHSKTAVKTVMQLPELDLAMMSL